MTKEIAKSKDGKVVGYIVGRGKFIPKKNMDAFALKKQAQNIPQTDADLRTKRVKKDSQALKAEKDLELANIISPLYDPAQLIKLAESNTYHRRCAKQIASDVAGLGWRLQLKAGLNLEDLEGQDKKDAETEKIRLEEFLQHPNPDQAWREIMEAGEYDYGLIGWECYEIVRDKEYNNEDGEEGFEHGPVKEVYHIPGHTIRKVKAEAGEPIKFLQKRGMKKTYFMPAGILKDDGKAWKLNRTTGKYEDELTATDMANELVFIPDYSPRDSYYGIPGIVSALGALLGAIGVRDYNIQFFENNAIPQYAVLMYGVTAGEDLTALIEQYFKEEIKGDAHSTLVLTVPGTKEEVEIEFKELAVEVREASFRFYYKQNRDEIIDAHGIPPHRVMAVESGALAGNYAREATEIYKASVVEPRQEVLERRFNTLVLRGKYWEFKFADLDTRDVVKDVKNYQILFGLGAMTPNQIREMMGWEAQDGGDEYYISKQYVPLSEAGALMMSKSKGGNEEATKEFVATIKDLRQAIIKALEE